MAVRYHDGVGDVSAFVLAGGQSFRMGSDKAMLRLGNETFLSIALRNARAICAAPVIVGDAGRYAAFGNVVDDRYPGCGPLGGIHAALCASVTELNLILSVDLPTMKPDFLCWLVSEAEIGMELATVPRLNGRSEPLCAVYRREILPVVERSLQAGRYKIDAIFSEVPTRFVSEETINSAGFDAEVFRNVNTPDDYERIKRRLVTAEAAEGRG